MNSYESITRKRHESRLQERRLEQSLETQRLNRLKLGLEVKLAASKPASDEKASAVRAA
jgi:hypothetical protein